MSIPPRFPKSAKPARCRPRSPRRSTAPKVRLAAEEAAAAERIELRYRTATRELKKLGISAAAPRRRWPVRAGDQERSDLQGIVQQLEEARFAAGRRDRGSVRQAGAHRRIHFELRSSQRSVRPRRRDARRDRSGRPDGHSDLRHRRWHRHRRRLQQRRLRQSHQGRPRPRHRNPLWPLVGDRWFAPATASSAGS